MLVSRNKDYFWNTVAGLINAAEAVLMSMIVTRISGLSDAGVITISFAIGNLMMTIGKFGVRNFQVTDINNSYHFSDYLSLRVVTVILMLLVSVVYLFKCTKIDNYSLGKSLSIGAIIFIYAIEALEDVVCGELQLKRNLAKGAQLFCIRWLGIFVVFLVSMLMHKDLVMALLSSAFASLIVFLFCLVIIVSKIQTIQLPLEQFHWRKIISLACKVLPLFVVSFLTFYVNNAPKYAIDGVVNEEIQACFGFVAMPVFVIGLLNNLIYQPTLVQLAQKWNEGMIAETIQIVIKQIVYIFLLTVFVLIGSYVVGIPLLSILYATNLRGYKAEMMILLIGGSFLATSGYFSVILTLMRRQKELLIGYSAIGIIAFLFLEACARKGGTVGVATGYTLLIFILTIFYGIVIVFQIIRAKKLQKLQNTDAQNSAS